MIEVVGSVTPEQIAEFQRTTRRNQRLVKVLKGYDYNEHNFQIDSEARLAIAGKALALQLDHTKTSATWKTNTKDGNGNDILYTFTKDEFIQFALDVEAYYEQLVLGS